MRNIAIVASVLLASPASAADLTVGQCLSILSGLNALNCVGQQLGGTCDPHSPQYKLGASRYTIALDTSLLGPVFDAARRAQQQFVAEMPIIPQPAAGKADEREVAQARHDQDVAANNNWNKIADAPCGVAPGHLKLSELKLGDGPDENAIPPAVLGAIAPIIDRP